MSENDQHIPLATPLKNMALALSGGGFRAASFSLGTMAYMHRLPTTIGADESGGPHRLLQNVSYISSASGGSFTNILYSAYLHKGKSFEACYAKLLQEMQGEGLLDRVLALLNDDAAWNQPGNEKRRNIINAFARVYDERLLEGETFGVYWDDTHVKRFEVCINATDFYRGLSFRFQTEGENNPFQVIGNNYLYFDTKQLETVKQIRLADMLASSSCFPIGFEPIVYPQDFTYNNSGSALTSEALTKAMLCEDYKEETHTISQPFGLMDGGITDNQGLKSALVADNRRRRRKEGERNPFDVIMVTDVASYFMDPYTVPDTKTTPAWRKQNIRYYFGKLGSLFGKLNLLGVLLMVLLLGCGAVLAFTPQSVWHNIAWFTGGASLVLLLILLVINRLRKKYVPQFASDGGSGINNYIKDELGLSKYFTNSIINKLLNYLSQTRLGVLEQMLKARLSSAMIMISDINLKQVRRLIYEMFYDGEQWNNRRIPNFIYEFSTYNIAARTNRFNSERRLGWKATEADKALLLGDCEQLNGIAEEARTMGTTLWFDQDDVKNDKLKKLVATGMFTACGNLLEYLVSLERKGLVFTPDVQQQLDDLRVTITADWQRFKREPFFMYDLYGQQKPLP